MRGPLRGLVTMMRALHGGTVDSIVKQVSCVPERSSHATGQEDGQAAPLLQRRGLTVLGLPPTSWPGPRTTAAELHRRRRLCLCTPPKQLPPLLGG